MNPTNRTPFQGTGHTYIRCGNEIYVGDSANQWRILHQFETEKRAKRWQRDQEKQRPGSVTVGSPPVEVTHARINQLTVDYERRRQAEIRKLVAQQKADQAMIDKNSYRQRMSTASGKTALLAQSYVTPDRDGSSSSRKPSRMPARSRKRKDTHETYGGS